MASAEPPAPLAGIKVLDLSRAVSGPYATRIFSDLGADVVKVEPPDGDITDLFGRQQAGRGALFVQMNAGKRNISLDLQQPGERDLALRLAGVADIVVENYRVGVLDRLGLGYQALTATNSKVILLSISGFGARSPEADRRAYAPVIHAESGLLLRQSQFDERPASDIGLALADTLAALHGGIAVLAALRLRELTGQGQHIDLSMLDATLASDDHVHYGLDGMSSTPDSLGVVWDAPGGPLMIAGNLKLIWASIKRVVQLDDGGSPDDTLDDKKSKRRRAIQDWMLRFDRRSDLIAHLEAARLPWADLRNPQDILGEKSLAANPPFDEIPDGEGGTRRVIRMPYRFSDARARTGRLIAQRNQHATEVLDDWLGED